MLGAMCLRRLCHMMRGVIGINLTFISIWSRPALVRRPFLFLGLGCRAGVPAVAGWILCRLPVAGRPNEHNYRRVVLREDLKKRGEYGTAPM